jgi:hypothetical protein
VVLFTEDADLILFFVNCFEEEIILLSFGSSFLKGVEIML